MNESEKKRYTIYAALLGVSVLVLGAALWRRYAPPAARADATLAALLQETMATREDAIELKELTEELSVKIPTGNADEQIAGFVAAMEEIGERNRLKYTRFDGEAVSPSRVRRQRRPGSEVTYRIAFQSNHAGFMKFLDGLSERGLPWRLDEASFEAESNRPDQVNVDFTISFILLEPDLNAAG